MCKILEWKLTWNVNISQTKLFFASAAAQEYIFDNLPISYLYTAYCLQNEIKRPKEKTYKNVSTLSSFVVLRRTSKTNWKLYYIK